MKKILYFITNDRKFTKGFINALMYHFKEYDNYFFVQKKENIFQVIDDSELYMYEDWKSLICNKKFQRLLAVSDKIIFSGLFETSKLLFHLPNKILKKTYIQFWGGDFYGYRDSKELSHLWLKKYLLRIHLKKVKAFIMLIDGDYEEISKIFCLSKSHFIAPVLSDPLAECSYEKYIGAADNSCCKILVGNSATKSNHHVEIFEKLSHLKSENIKIICPLSYGEEEYREYVIAKGTKLFGDKFEAITEYLSKDEYYRFLSECTIAILNNDRQQALGNIYMLIELQKKIYIREDIPTWGYLKKNGMELNSISELDNIKYDNLIFQNQEQKRKNSLAWKKIRESYLEQWKKVLENI